MVDAIGLQMDFTLETNRKRVKEENLKQREENKRSELKTPRFYLSDLELKLFKI